MSELDPTNTELNEEIDPLGSVTRSKLHFSGLQTALDLWLHKERLKP